MKADSILKAVGSVTSKWEKQRKAEVRGKSRSARARTLVRTYRTTIKEVAWSVMEGAYLKASDNGRLPALARQIMYAARPAILEKTGESELDSQYFTQVLLPDYMEEHGCEDWNVAYDARGNFHEPHTKKKVPLGTIDVRQYLRDVRGGGRQSGISVNFDDSDRFPTCGPANRYSAVLFIEKEGFLPLLNEAKIAERFDIAIMSTKGLSVTAARELVDEICGKHDIPLLVMHDLDKAGFSIGGTLRRDTRRYSFTNDIEVIDIGLRLDDVKKYDLQSETATYKGIQSKVRSNLARNGATDDELAFLCKGGSYANKTTFGDRVELNAFTSSQFIEWLEAKLEEHGITKLVPDDSAIEQAYRRALEVSIVRERIGAIEEEAADLATEAALPADLRLQITNALDDTRSQPWDEAVMQIAKENAADFLDDSDDDDSA